MAPPIGLVVSLVGVSLTFGCSRSTSEVSGEPGADIGKPDAADTVADRVADGAAATTTVGLNADAALANSTTDGGPATSDAGPYLPAPAMASAGCGKPADQGTARYVRHMITVGANMREYFIYLPKNYDPMRPYRTIFLWTGCGGTGLSALPMQNSSGENAILVSGTPGPVRGDGCFDDQVPNSIDLPFFDEMLKSVSASYCVDSTRIFSVGFSSGSWMTNILGCARASVLRGQGNVSGGFPRRVTPCGGPVAGMLIHDPADPQNGIAGGRAARDRLLKVNGCSNTTVPYDPAPCVSYEGCKSGFPVIWCETPGKGHSPQNSLSVPGFWKLFSQI